MCVPAAAVQKKVSVPQGKAVGYRSGRRAYWKRDEHLPWRQRDIGNAWQAFIKTANLQILQFQPDQPCREISTPCYGEFDTGIAESGFVAIWVAKRKYIALCHMPPVGSADSSCDEFFGLTASNIGQLTALDYATSEVRR
jgi:hypothetical protein